MTIVDQPLIIYDVAFLLITSRVVIPDFHLLIVKVHWKYLARSPCYSADHILIIS